MSDKTLQRCKELAEQAKKNADGWVSGFANNYEGKVMFCLALANAVMVMRILVPGLRGTGDDFIAAVKEGTALWVELGEPKTAVQP